MFYPTLSRLNYKVHESLLHTKGGNLLIKLLRDMLIKWIVFHETILRCVVGVETCVQGSTLCAQNLSLELAFLS